ncbi:TetR/AcrR family transcriptional regulator [Streptodolium elevatio]
MERSRPPSAGHDHDTTRARVIQATLGCILDKGFYRASSNEIARRAGVSWGVIQHHFGTREALMVAAHRDGGALLEQLVEQADVGGEHVTERLTRYWELLDSYYGRPEYLARLQISLNLTRDPAVSAEAVATIVETDERIRKRFVDLEQQVAGDCAAPPDTGFLFHTLRGLALSHATLAGTTPAELKDRRHPEDRQTHAWLLIAALARQFGGDAVSDV